MKIPKFRPVLTSVQISHIISLCTKSLSPDSYSVMAVLTPFKAKIDNNAICPAYVLQEKQSLAASLGFEKQYSYEGLNPGEQMDLAYEKWQLNPESCSVKELELVRTHMWANNLLTPEESAKYEAELQKVIDENGML